MKKKFLNVLAILKKIPESELREIEFYDMIGGDCRLIIGVNPNYPILSYNDESYSADGRLYADVGEPILRPKNMTWEELDIKYSKPKCDFEIGEWLITAEGSLVRFGGLNKHGNVMTKEYYRINSLGSLCCGGSDGYTSIDLCSKAASVQIRDMLSKVAVIKGFVDGVEFLTPKLKDRAACGSTFTYGHDNDILFCDDISIYNESRGWAKIVEKPKAEYRSFNYNNSNLRGVWVKNTSNDNEYLITGFTEKSDNCYLIINAWYSNKQLFENFTYRDGSLIGEKI